MYTLSESVLIKAPPRKIFEFIKYVEPRLKLSPAYRLLGCEKITGGEIGPGTRFRIQMLAGGARSEYVSEVVEFVENERLVTRDIEGRVKVSITLEEAPEGTLYTHTEEFTLPEGVAEAAAWERQPWYFKALSVFTWPWSALDEKKGQERAIVKSLEESLRVFLGRIKDRMEKG
jgi:hypothetical protein